MQIVHFSRVELGQADLESVALLHCEWAAGLGRFERLRERRLAQGFPPELTPRDLLDDNDGDRWVFKLTLPHDDGTTRTSVVRATQDGPKVTVEHLVVRRGDRAQLALPQGDAPAVVAHLLALRGVAGVGRAERVREADVLGLVRRLLDPTRRDPVVLVSVDNHTGEAIVDPDELARRMMGVVRVVYLEAPEASRALKEQLLARGFSSKFGCYMGAVRLLRPGLANTDDIYEHLLLLPVRLRSYPNGDRTACVAGVFCELLAEDEEPRRMLREVEPPADPPPTRRTRAWPAADRASDVSTPPAVSESASSDSPAPPGEAAANEAPAAASPSFAQSESTSKASTTEAPRASTERTAASDPKVDPEPGVAAAPVSSEPEPSQALEPPTEHEAPPTGSANDDGEAVPEPVLRVESAAVPSAAHRAGASTWRKVADDVVAALELADELEAENAALREELAEVRRSLRRAELERDELLPDNGAPVTAEAELGDALRALVETGEPTLEQSLQILEALYPERVVVLPEAYRSARDSASFKKKAKAWELLSRLATDYWHAIQGGGDTEAKEVFSPSSFSTRESETVEGRGSAMARRTFDYRGEPLTMVRHLKIGVKQDSLTETWRCHFAWLAESRTLVIGHCGGHLDFK